MSFHNRKTGETRAIPKPEPKTFIVGVRAPNGQAANLIGGRLVRFDGKPDVIGTPSTFLDVQFTLPADLDFGALFTGHFTAEGCGELTTVIMATSSADPVRIVQLPPVPDTFTPCAREYAGNMCGIRVAGLPPVLYGPDDLSLVPSWYLDRYPVADQARIIERWKALGHKDVLLGWPDSRSGGMDGKGFGEMCRNLRRHGLNPCVMLCSKDLDPADVPELKRRMSEVLPHLVKNAPRICVGWELSLWLSYEQVQELIDWLAPQVNPWGGKLYVHFQQGYPWMGSEVPVAGTPSTFAAFWNPNIGKLTGLLHQRDLTWDEQTYQDKLGDILDRFAGQAFCSPDSGFGHPFDCICLEITAMDQTFSGLSEAEGNRWGRVALATPERHGPFGPVRIMGSGNGF